MPKSSSNSQTATLPIPDPTAHVALFRATDPQYVLVYVEGPGDFRMWRYWFRHPPQVANGKRGVIAAIRRLKERSIPGIVGIVDSDNEVHDLIFPDLIVTERNDIESDLVNSSALDRMVSQCAYPDDGPRGAVGYGHYDRLDQDGATDLLREDVLTAGVHFARIRRAFRTAQTEYPTGRFSPSRFTTISASRRIAVDTDKLWIEAEMAISASRDKTATADTVPRILDEARSTTISPGECNGHDLAGILCRALTSVGGAACVHKTQESVSSALRLAVDREILAELRVWSDICRWDEAHPSFSLRAAPQSGSRNCTP